jgi:hypothetical protein
MVRIVLPVDFIFPSDCGPFQLCVSLKRDSLDDIYRNAPAIDCKGYRQSSNNQ